MGNQSNDPLQVVDGKITSLKWLRNGILNTKTEHANPMVEISSFQSLCALLWQAVTRAWKIPSSKTTTFRMAVNCRHQFDQKLDPYYFGNAIQSILTYASAGDDPRCFPLGNFDGAMITMGSLPRFPMYDNDFGWGRAVAMRSWRANKFDGKISAFSGREGGGTVDLEVPKTMAGLELDSEFMYYVSGY
ncbi:unnamed protein product [Ilex paraguariensis]|uniref:Uncharacterized protein n=1 Tax=Ilex paraguariensis TaxID=185542 RepID=A0ABC8QT36_9AQUA